MVIHRLSKYKILSLRIAKVGSEQLLEHIQKYFNDTLEGGVLRFAITGASGAALVVDVSIKVDDTAQKTKKDGKKRSQSARFV